MLGPLQDNRKGVPELLFFFDLWAIVSGVSIVACRPTNLADVLPKDITDELTCGWVSKHVTLVALRGLPVVFAKLALPPRIGVEVRGPPWPLNSYSCIRLFRSNRKASRSFQATKRSPKRSQGIWTVIEPTRSGPTRGCVISVTLTSNGPDRLGIHTQTTNIRKRVHHWAEMED